MLKYLCMAFGWSVYSHTSLFPLSSSPTLLVTTDVSFRVELCFCLSCFTVCLGLYFFFFEVVSTFPSEKKSLLSPDDSLFQFYSQLACLTAISMKNSSSYSSRQEKDWCFLVHLCILLKFLATCWQLLAKFWFSSSCHFSHIYPFLWLM